MVLPDGSTWYPYRGDARPYTPLPAGAGMLDRLPGPVRPEAAPCDDPGRCPPLTTCEPEWGSSNRLIARAHLDATRPVTEGKPEALRELPD